MNQEKQVDKEQQSKEILINNVEVIQNILRILCMLEKALNRLARRNYYNRNQYPEIFFEVEEAIMTLRTWIQRYQIFYGLFTFTCLLSIYIKELNKLIGELIVQCKPLRGKKGIKKSSLVKEEENLCNSINFMLNHIEISLDKAKRNETIISRELEKSLFKAFEIHCQQEHEKKVRFSVSKRGRNTYIFPCPHKDKFFPLIYDRKRFKAEVVDKLGNFPHATGHRLSCKGHKKYDLAGFRSTNRKTITKGGKQEEFPIPVVKCVSCHKSFSLLPSFLPREKHFEIDIIGTVIRSIVLFSQSLQGAIEITRISGRKIKSKQTILNWLRWFGILHPGTVLTRAGIKGSGYFQEDEGFEKEPDLRTYTVSMIEPETLLLWHVDYIDHVDEETLCDSFEKFAERIDFKVLGVTKDKWKPSTNALKKVFHNLWLGFCHLHCLKNFRKSLSEYQKKTGCSLKKINKLYKEFKKVLDSSPSKTVLEIRISSLTDQAFKHPLLKQSLDKVVENAAHYTCHKKRKGITKTTSMVDNFLKNVKRKLRQVESFRDKDDTRILFQAMANVRNFTPFLPGAKNSHKSPFMLAQGQTYDLPWLQVMNIHNAFLFTEDAF